MNKSQSHSDNEMQQLTKRVDNLESFAKEAAINIVQLTEQQKNLRTDTDSNRLHVSELSQAEIRRDERTKTWKYIFAIFVIGLIIGAIINDVHVIKLIFGK